MSQTVHRLHLSVYILRGSLCFFLCLVFTASQPQAKPGAISKKRKRKHKHVKRRARKRRPRPPKGLSYKEVRARLKQISDYRVLRKLYVSPKGERFLVTRSYKRKGQAYYLMVNTETLRSHIRRQDDIVVESLDKAYRKSKLYGLLRRASRTGWRMHNAGFRYGLVKEPKAFYLTIDLCPSRYRGFDKAFFESLVTLSRARRKGPLPVGLAITGRWLSSRPDAFQWLLKQRQLTITWINHSFYHRYIKDEELKHNFMRHPRTSLHSEITKTERLLLSYGQTPSVFFRFPGLVSSRPLLRRLLYRYSLLPLGSNAWIARRQRIRNGSIVLLHGNRNEPQGLARFQKLLSQGLMSKRKFQPYPIHEAF